MIAALYCGWISSSNVPGMGAKTADGGPEVDSNCADGKTVSLLCSHAFHGSFCSRFRARC